MGSSHYRSNAQPTSWTHRTASSARSALITHLCVLPPRASTSLMRSGSSFALPSCSCFGFLLPSLAILCPQLLDRRSLKLHHLACRLLVKRSFRAFDVYRIAFHLNRVGDGTNVHTGTAEHTEVVVNFKFRCDFSGLFLRRQIQCVTRTNLHARRTSCWAVFRLYVNRAFKDLLNVNSVLDGACLCAPRAEHALIFVDRDLAQELRISDCPIDLY